MGGLKTTTWYRGNMTKKILIIEDDTFISDMYSRSLRSEGYEVSTVISGSEGQKLANTGVYSLIFLDLMIPDVLGIDVLREVRKNLSEEAQPKIIISTNYDEDEETKNELIELADGYIIKAETTPSTILDLAKDVIGAP